MNWPALALLAACACACACGARGPLRVLAAFPHPGRSHALLGHSVVDVLLAAGHEVTYVTSRPPAARPGLRSVDVSSLAGAEQEDEWLELSPPAALQAGAALAARALRHRAVRALLADRARGFDVVVADWFHSELLAPLGAVYECPLVWYSAGDVSWHSLRLVHAAGGGAALAAEPHTFALADRARQLLMHLYLTGWTYYMTHYVEQPIYREVYGPALLARGRAPPAYEALALDASLLLVNSHPPLGRRPLLPPSVQYVGGHHVRRPTDPLPPELQKILDSAVNGAIFFSMGSNLKSEDFPERMKRELAELLGQLEQPVLWALKEPPPQVPANLHVLGWAPQASILNHSNTILFISHGGPLSVMEATQFGVPIVGVPLSGDQLAAMDQAVARGCGIRVDLAPDLPVRIKEAVNEILGNFSYRGQAAVAAAQFAARAAPARLALASWVRAAADTRGARHLRSPAPPPLAGLPLDLLLLLLVLWLLTKVLQVVRARWTLSTEDSDKKDK